MKMPVLFIGHGSPHIVHNLRVVDMMNMDAKPYDWAVEFDGRVKRDLLDRNHTALLDCQNMSRATSLAVPTLDHYLPMIFAIGLQEKGDALEFLHEGFQNSSVSMRCFKVGGSRSAPERMAGHDARGSRWGWVRGRWASLGQK